MSAAANLLNMDVAEVGALLKRGADWWTAELKAMLPPGWVRPARPDAVASLVAGSVRVDRGGSAVAPDPARPVRAAIALDPALVLVRTIQLPRLPPADLRRAVALDLDRLTPFGSDEVWFDLRNEPAAAPSRRTPVQLAVVRRVDAAAVLDRCAEAGVDPGGLGVADGRGGVAFDFLPAIVAAVAPPPWWARRDLWWGVAGALAVATVALAVYRDHADVARLQDLVAAQSDAVSLSARLKARVDAEDRRRAQLADGRVRSEPLQVIAALTRAVPPPAWAQRLEWDGRRVTLGGFAPASVDVLAAIQSDPAFRDVRSGGAEIAPGDLASPPFELSAQWAAAR